ncbi:hypothetical protein NBRC116188_25920 [Oceaniserpentilla sp. 4NH20-0058]
MHEKNLNDRVSSRNKRLHADAQKYALFAALHFTTKTSRLGAGEPSVETVEKTQRKIKNALYVKFEESLMVKPMQMLN